MPSSPKVLLSWCFTLPLLYVADAQSAAQGALETVVVTGSALQDSALTNGLIVKPEEEIFPGARVDVAEILQGMPGIQVDSRTNFAQDTRISLRGYGARSAFGVRGIDLLVDGIPLSMPDGQGQFSSVMLDQLETVQVLRGPMAVLYGNGAGGVIAAQTLIPENNAAQFGVAVGEDGFQKQQLNLQGRQNNLGGSVAYSQMEQDGERPHAGAEREQLAAQLFYQYSNNVQLRVKHDLTDDPLLQDPLGLTPEQWRSDPHQANVAAENFDTRKSVRHQQTSLNVRQASGDLRWQASTWAGTRDITQYLGFSGESISGSGGVVDLDREFGGVNANISQDLIFMGRPSTATLGAEWMHMEDHRRGYVNNLGIAGDKRRDEVGDVESQDVYSMLQMDLTDRWNIYAGVRHTRVEFDVDDAFIVPPSDTNSGNPDDSGSRDYSNTAFASGARWTINTNWGISLGYGRGYETPTLTEMAYRTQGAGLNTELDAADNKQYEMSLHFQNNFSEIHATVFVIDTHNELVVDQSLNGRTSYTNAAATRREGAELFARINMSDGWRLQFSAIGIDAVYAQGSFEDNQLPGVAKEQYQWDVQYLPFADERLILSAGVHKRTAVAANDSNEIVAPGFYRVDTGVEGKSDIQQFALEWWLKATNLTDENYVGSVIVNQSNGRAFEPAPGFGVLGGISLRY